MKPARKLNCFTLYRCKYDIFQCSKKQTKLCMKRNSTWKLILFLFCSTKEHKYDMLLCQEWNNVHKNTHNFIKTRSGQYKEIRDQKMLLLSAVLFCLNGASTALDVINRMFPTCIVMF